MQKEIMVLQVQNYHTSQNEALQTHLTIILWGLGNRV